MHPTVRPFSVQEMSKKKQTLNNLREERGMLKLKISARGLQNNGNASAVDSNQQYEVQQLKARLAILEKAIERADQMDQSSGTSDYTYWLSKADIICTTLGSCVSLMQ